MIPEKKGQKHSRYNTAAPSPHANLSDLMVCISGVFVLENDWVHLLSWGAGGGSLMRLLVTRGISGIFELPVTAGKLMF